MRSSTKNVLLYALHIYNAGLDVSKEFIKVLISVYCEDHGPVDLSKDKNWQKPNYAWVNREGGLDWILSKIVQEGDGRSDAG